MAPKLFVTLRAAAGERGLRRKAWGEGAGLGGGTKGGGALALSRAHACDPVGVPRALTRAPGRCRRQWTRGRRLSDFRPCVAVVACPFPGTQGVKFVKG